MKKRFLSPSTDGPERVSKWAKLSPVSVSDDMLGVEGNTQLPKSSPGMSVPLQNQRNKRKRDEEFNADDHSASLKRARADEWREPAMEDTCNMPEGSTFGVHLSSSRIGGAYCPDATQKYEDPYFRYELQGQEHRGISFDRFLQAVFPECPRMDGIATSGEVQECLQAYLEVVNRTGSGEKDMYDPFFELVSSIIAAAGDLGLHYIQTYKGPPHGAVGNSIRKPDGVIVHKRADGSFPAYEPNNRERHVKWSEVLFPVELEWFHRTERGNRATRKKQLKKSKKSPMPILPKQSAVTFSQLQDTLHDIEKHQKLNHREQLASYALEILSSNPLKRSTMGMYVLGDRLEVWYFDRLGCLGSETLALYQEAHFRLFVKMVARLVNSSAEALGFEPSFKFDDWPYSLDSCALEIPVSVNGVTSAPVIAAISSDEPLHRSRCLSGRGTSVLPVRLSSAVADATFVMKIGWQASTRMSEADFYKKAAGVNGLPNIECSATIVDSLRAGVWERLENSLPPKSNRSLPEDRSLRVLIMTGRYYPLSETIGSESLFHDPKKLLGVMKSLLSVHWSLLHKGILHRDVNPLNFMWTSGFTACLIDLDLSSMDDEAHHNPQDIPLTFSTPFLALDLLAATTPQPYLYRHDLEAFYWSFVWIVLDHLPLKSAKHSIRAWQKGSKRQIYRAKKTLLTSQVFVALSREFPSYKPIALCLQKLTKLITRAYEHLEPEPGSDLESNLNFPHSDVDPYLTGGGCITYDTFLAIFTQVEKDS